MYRGPTGRNIVEQALCVGRLTEIRLSYLVNDEGVEPVT